MSKFEMVKKFYQKKLWGLGRVRDAVSAGWITEEQFQKITGKAFEESSAEVQE